MGGGSSAESALAWNEFAAADAADWDNFDDEGKAAKGNVLLVAQGGAIKRKQSCVKDPCSSRCTTDKAEGVRALYAADL